MRQRHRQRQMPRVALLVSLLAALCCTAAGSPKKPPIVLPLKRRPLPPDAVANAIAGGRRRLQVASTQMELYSAEWGQGCVDSYLDSPGRHGNSMSACDATRNESPSASPRPDGRSPSQSYLRVYTFEVQVGEQEQPFEVVADTGAPGSSACEPRGPARGFSLFFACITSVASACDDALPAFLAPLTGSVLFFVPCTPGCTPQTCGYHEASCGPVTLAQLTASAIFLQLAARPPGSSEGELVCPPS